MRVLRGCRVWMGVDGDRGPRSSPPAGSPPALGASECSRGTDPPGRVALRSDGRDHESDRRPARYTHHRREDDPPASDKVVDLADDPAFECATASCRGVGREGEVSLLASSASSPADQGCHLGRGVVDAFVEKPPFLVRQGNANEDVLADGKARWVVFVQSEDVDQDDTVDRHSEHIPLRPAHDWPACAAPHPGCASVIRASPSFRTPA
jgi:hypothetical protein